VLGIFDSGFGGLSVLRAIRKALPEHDMMYLGDSARTPYGTRSREIVTRYTKECCLYLFERGCHLIVLACNTASAETLRELQQRWLPALRKNANFESQSAKNIIGVIRPIEEEAVLQTKNNVIGVVGTRSTVQSQAYVEELTALNPDVTVVQQACPLLVPLVEEGWERKPETRMILRKYLQPLKTRNPDLLILACTHYEALHKVFQQKMGSRCMVFHSPPILAKKLVQYLQHHPEYDKHIPRRGRTVFLTTGDTERFSEIGERFYGKIVDTVENVEVENVFPCQNI
jgi:glutamate racemase